MNLYMLELRKIRLLVYIKAAAGIFVSLLAIGILFLFIYETETGVNSLPEDVELFSDWNGLLSLMTALVFACFSVLSAVVAAKVIVSEYCGRNAVILLGYPVKRRAMLAAKCLLVCRITAIAACVSNILIIATMYAAAHIFGIVPLMNTEHFVVTVLLSGVLAGVIASAVGIISAAFGWKKRSVISTIVCSLIIVCAVTNLIPAAPDHMLLVILAMAVVFTAAARLVYLILVNEIENMEV